MKSPSVTASEDCELLFFDTFSHESCEELNLDLVQFPRPVYIYEIRVIPLGARVQADFPGGHRLGATNPSAFQLEFFVNHLSKRSSCTFERLGILEYKQNIEIQFPVLSKIPTDGLVLRGLYSAVTLAVYGVTKTSSKGTSSPQPPPGSQSVSRSQSQDHRQIHDSPASVDWDRHARPVDATPEPPQPIHPRSQTIVEGPRFAEVPPIIHPQPEAHVQYAAEIPPVYPEPPPPMVYPECIPASVPSVPPPSPYPPYDNSRYAKPWSAPEDHYQAHEEGYSQPVYCPSDNAAYPPSASVPHAMWDPKECHPPPEIARQEHDPYDHKMHSRDKDRDRRDKLWDRDNHPADDNSRDRDYKRRERDHRSWERGSPERYRDRDRVKDSSSRDRDRDRERSRDLGRDKPRSHDNYGERGSRLGPKRPATPPTPPPPPSIRSRTPQSPPEMDKPLSGPRTPKEEEPSETFDEPETSRGHIESYYSAISSEQRPNEPIYNLSEGEIQEGDNTEDDDGYEEIVSEEEIMSDGEDRVLDLGDMEYDLADESWNYMSSFSPYQCELIPCQHFKDPTLSSFELAKNDKKYDPVGEKTENKILEMVKLFDGKEHTEKWVEALESLNSEIIAESLLPIDSKPVYEDAVNTLISWVIEGLSYDFALRQPQTAYKIRHLKAGIRLSSLLLQTNSKIIEKLLNHQIPKLLLQLFDQSYMTLPVKLLILRALDAVTYTKAGFDFLLNQTLEFPPATEFDFGSVREQSNSQAAEGITSKTGYQKLLELVLSKQLTRAVVSITALLEKIHLYETLLKLKESVENIKHVLAPPAVDVKPPSDEPCADSESQPVRPDSDIEMNDIVINSTTYESSVQVVITCLNEISLKLRTAWKTLAHQKRFLPANSQFEIQKSPFDPYPGILRIFKESHLLNSILTLLSSPLLTNHPAIIVSVRNLFMELLQSQNGMLFLLSSPDIINSIQKSLLQNVDESRDEASDDNITQNLGMQIVYHLQAVLYTDCLLSYHSRGGLKKELEDTEAVSALHHMYTMIFSSFGRPAIAHVLTTDHNLNALLPFIQMTGEEELDIKLSKSVYAAYVTELLMNCVHFSETISIYETFSETLYDLSQQELTPKLHDLGLWMAPARQIPNYTHEAVPYLIGVMKSHLDNASSLPPELITAVKILKHICLPPKDQESQELKYMYATIQVYSNDGFSFSLTILQNVCDTFLKPSHQSVALVGLQGVLLVALVKPIISLMKNMLSYLILCINTEFKDLTAVPVFLQTYSLMLMIPPSSFSFQQAQVVQNEIIECLLTYTQSSLGPPESEETLSKSLWTLMLQEVMKYAHQSPRTFITGLTVLTELLPLPLPLQTREALSTEEISKTVNHRKLWSAHLHSLSIKIQEIILSLAASSCHPLQQLLRRICIQLSDLAAPTALVVVRAVLDAFLDSIEPENKEVPEPAVGAMTTTTATTTITSSAPQNSPAVDPQSLKPCGSTTTRILNLVSNLVGYFAFKVPMMHIIRGSSKADEKYVDALSVLLNLLNLTSDKQSHIQSQECIVSIIQSLCDPDIGFITVENGTSVNEVLSSCLPLKEHMLQICNALVQHVGNNHSYTSVLPSMRTLVMLAEHDYGFYHVKLALESCPDSLRSLFGRLSSSFKKDNTDCLSTLSTTLEFLRLMVNGYEEGEQTGRSMLLPSSHLAVLLSNRNHGTKMKEKEDIKINLFQPLLQLEKHLSDCANDEEAIESLLESVSSLIILLKDGSNKEDKTEIKEPILPPPESLSAQYASRCVFVVGDIDEERLNPAYWLTLPIAEEADPEPEQVTLDLVALAEKYVSGEFNLKSSIENLCSSIESESDLKAKDKSAYAGKRKFQAGVNPGSSDGTKRAFVAPMRGRGFSRGANHSTRANDPFRSRPPNTSRPPSMHVDDFLALETHHPGSSGSSQGKRPENPRGRGRGGFDRNQAFTSVRGGGNNSGRFFSPPGTYGRRDISNRGNGRGTTRISNSTWGNRTNSSMPKSSIGTGVRTSFNARPSVSERCNYNSPFVQPEPRIASQRNRDPYPELGVPPSSVPVSRYTRDVRTVGVIGAPMQGHWQENRNKAQNPRFITSTSAGRGSGRRDMNGRHARSFTR